ncbi:MAG: RHS repeat-associated core domain-containing protein [Gammaproteobacteria bacterium]
MTTLYSAQYTRDGLGRISQKVETIGGVTATFGYDYDAAGRLSEVSKNSAVTATYTYDANGNRLSGPGLATPPTYDDQDRLLAYAGNTYTYTANGELATKVVGGNTTTYQYDVLGNLRAVTLPGNVQIQYLIDGQNRRIGKRVGGALTQGFLYEDELRIAAELSGANAVVSRFIYASRANVPDYLTKGGVTYRVITDHLGSVRLVVNAASGAVAQRLDYDEFGKVTLDTSPGFQPFGFAGGLYDKDTKLVRFGARDYDAETGRWTLKDPLYFAGRDSNLYAYALGNPITYADPSGLWPKGPVEWAQWLAKNTALQHKEARKKQLEEELKDANCKDREKKQEELNNLNDEIAKLKQELDQLWNPPATPEPTTNNPPGQQGSGSNPLWDWYLKWNDSHQIK